MGNWITEIKKQNRELKKKIKEMEKQQKEVAKTPKTITVVKVSKKDKVLKHKLHNLIEANKEYESIIERFSEENDVLRTGELEAQRMFDGEQGKRKVFKGKAIRVVRILNKILVDLPDGAIEKFKDSQDYPVFVKFYNTYLKNKPVHVEIEDDGSVKEV